MRAPLFFVFSLFLFGCTAQETAPLRVEQAWIPEIPPMISVTAGWMVIHNDGATPRYLTGAFSPNAESIEIHQSVVVNDMARMVLQSELEVPAHGSLVFSDETGYHLMLYKSRGMNAGARIPVTLTFKDGSALTADFTVRDRRTLDQ
jgi:copper(I)-binding protein